MFSSRISSSFPFLHNTINMRLRQQSGIVRLKYTLYAYMHKLCAREIRVTTIHHCTHTRIYLTHIFVHVWHANHSHFETLYLASYWYCIHMYMYMYMYNVELLFNRHVTDIIIIIILRFLLPLYLWLHCEFRALIICIYMYIHVHIYIVTYTYLFCTSCPQYVLCQLAIIGRCGLYTSNSPSPSSYLYLHTVFCSHHPLSWPLMYM